MTSQVPGLDMNIVIIVWTVAVLGSGLYLSSTVPAESVRYISSLRYQSGLPSWRKSKGRPKYWFGAPVILKPGVELQTAGE